MKRNEKENYIIPSLISDENDSQDFISLLSQEEEEEMNKENMPDMEASYNA